MYNFRIEKNHPNCINTTDDSQPNSSLLEFSQEFSKKSSKHFFSESLLQLYVLLYLIEETKTTKFFHNDNQIKNCIDIVNIVLNQEPNFKILYCSKITHVLGPL